MCAFCEQHIVGLFLYTTFVQNPVKSPLESFACLLQALPNWYIHPENLPFVDDEGWNSRVCQCAESVQISNLPPSFRYFRVIQQLLLKRGGGGVAKYNVQYKLSPKRPKEFLLNSFFGCYTWLNFGTKYLIG